MKILKSTTLLLIGGISIVSLTGCEQVEQAASVAVERAKESAVKVVDEARQSGSIDDARQSADRALQEAKQAAAGLLGQASEFLANEPQEQGNGDEPGADPAPAL